MSRSRIAIVVIPLVLLGLIATATATMWLSPTTRAVAAGETPLPTPISTPFGAVGPGVPGVPFTPLCPPQEAKLHGGKCPTVLFPPGTQPPDLSPAAVAAAQQGSRAVWRCLPDGSYEITETDLDGLSPRFYRRSGQVSYAGPAGTHGGPVCIARQDPTGTGGSPPRDRADQ